MAFPSVLQFSRRTVYLIVLATVLAITLASTGLLLQQSTSPTTNISGLATISGSTVLINTYNTPQGNLLVVTSAGDLTNINVTSYNSEGNLQWFTNYEKPDIEEIYTPVLGTTIIENQIYVGILVSQSIQQTQEIILIGRDGIFPIMQNNGSNLEETILSGHSLYYLTRSEYANASTSETFRTYNLHRIILSAALLNNPTDQIIFQQSKRISYDINGTIEEEPYFAGIFPLGNLENYVVMDSYFEEQTDDPQPYTVFERDTRVASYSEDEFTSVYSTALFDYFASFTLMNSGVTTAYQYWMTSGLFPPNRFDIFVINELHEDLLIEPTQILNVTFQIIEGYAPRMQYEPTHWSQGFGKEIALQLSDTLAFIPFNSPMANLSISRDQYVVVEDFLGFLVYQNNDDFVLEPLSFELRSNYDNTIGRKTLMLAENIIVTSLIISDPVDPGFHEYEIHILSLFTTRSRNQLLAQSLQIASPVLWIAAITLLIRADRMARVQARHTDLYPRKLE